MSVPSTLPSLRFENAGVALLDAGIATLGQVFLKGEVPSGSGLTALVNGVSVAVQLDVKTRYDDGSVKMAALSVERPSLAAGQSVAVDLVVGAAPAAPALDLGQALVGHSLVVDMSVAGGATYQVDVLAELAKALSAGTASFWQKGALASEARVEVMLAGSQRMVFDVTAFKGGGFSVDAQFNNDRAMETLGGTVSYNLAVELDGRKVMQESVTQAQYQNVQRSFSSNSTDGGQGLGDASTGWLNIRQDIAHLQATGAVANYDLSLVVKADLLASYGNAIAASTWGDVLANNGVTQYMPATGGRADIGMTTLSNTSWLISQDVRAAEYSLGQAQASGAVPWNMWNARGNTWLNDDAYPDLWLDARGGTGTAGNPNSGGLTQQVSGSTGWAPDTAHLPDLSYVPYVLTGERWMLDNLQAQAAWTVLIAWPGYGLRGDTDDIVVNQQVRGAAWSLRQLGEAAWTAPDGSAEKAYFQSVVDHNWAWLVSKIPEWTNQQGEAHGWVPGEYGIPGALPPWQQDYFASTTIAAAKQGNADALTFLKWQENFLVGRFLATADGFNTRDGVAYLIATHDPASGRIYTTWQEIGAKTVAAGWSNGDSWVRSDGNYGQLGLATLAALYDLTGSAQTKAAYDKLVALNPPYTSDFSGDPGLAIAKPDPSQPPFVIQDTTSDVAPVTGTPPNLDVQVPLTIKLGADSWLGDPNVIIKVDGIQVFSGTISAQHATGGKLMELGMVSASRLHEISVNFTNDAWGGTADTDRNLYVEAILVNGVATGQSQALMAAGVATFSVDPAKYVVTKAVQAPPPSLLVPLTIKLGADSWLGDPNVIIKVDGIQVFSGTISAQHATGGKLMELGMFSASATHEISVNFTNDAWGGTADTDRNLYVEAILVNGVATGQSQALMSAGIATFSVDPAKYVVTKAVQAPPPSLLVPLTIKLGADSWLGDPNVIIKVDGIQVFSGTISAQHATGGKLMELGMFSASATHEISVNFTNDAWGGTADTDRNLYVEAILVNGVATGQSQALMSAGIAIFNVDPAKYVVTKAVQPPPPPSYLGDDNVVLTTATQFLATDLLSGNDTLTLADGGNAGTVTNVEQLFGGAGNDIITLLAPPAGMLIDLKGGLNEVRISDGGSSLQLLNVQTVKGGTGADAVTLKGAMLGWTMDGGAGMDSLRLANGTNRVSLANVETISGGTGNDDVTLVTPAADAFIDLGLGTDSLTLAAGGNLVRVVGVETIIGGAGNDVVKLQAAQVGFSIQLGAGLDEVWLGNGGNTGTIANVEKIVGGAGVDQITLGTAWSFGSLDLGDGLDRLTLSSAGANTITVFNTENVLGGIQADTLTLGTAVLNGSFDLGGGNDVLFLAAATNSVTTTNVETVKGSSGADTITALGGTSVRLEGGGGRDILRGGGGNDVIYGGTGADVMSGGAGADRFLFTSLSESTTSAPDVISDFNATMDLIAFQDVAHNGFSWRGASSFVNNGLTQARFEDRTDVLSMDIDGNGTADFTLILTGVNLVDLSASDFIWG